MVAKPRQIVVPASAAIIRHGELASPSSYRSDPYFSAREGFVSSNIVRYFFGGAGVASGWVTWN